MDYILFSFLSFSHLILFSVVYDIFILIYLYSHSWCHLVWSCLLSSTSQLVNGPSLASDRNAAMPTLITCHTGTLTHAQKHSHNCTWMHGDSFAHFLKELLSKAFLFCSALQPCPWYSKFCLVEFTGHSSSGINFHNYLFNFLIIKRIIPAWQEANLLTPTGQCSTWDTQNGRWILCLLSYVMSHWLSCCFLLWNWIIRKNE